RRSLGQPSNKAVREARAHIRCAGTLIKLQSAKRASLLSCQSASSHELDAPRRGGAMKLVRRWRGPQLLTIARPTQKHRPPAGSTEKTGPLARREFAKACNGLRHDRLRRHKQEGVVDEPAHVVAGLVLFPRRNVVRGVSPLRLSGADAPWGVRVIESRLLCAA